MMELNCAACHRQWYIEETDGMEVRYCPYCADNIWEQEKVASFDQALSKIIKMSGCGILRERNRLAAYLSDLAPNHRKEIRIFTKSCSDTLLGLFYISDQGGHTRQQAISKAEQILMDSEGLSQKWTDIVVNALVKAFGWEPDGQQL